MRVMVQFKNHYTQYVIKGHFFISTINISESTKNATFSCKLFQPQADCAVMVTESWSKKFIETTITDLDSFKGQSRQFVTAISLTNTIFFQKSWSFTVFVFVKNWLHLVVVR